MIKLMNIAGEIKLKDTLITSLFFDLPKDNYSNIIKKLLYLNYFPKFDFQIKIKKIKKRFKKLIIYFEVIYPQGIGYYKLEIQKNIKKQLK